MPKNSRNDTFSDDHARRDKMLRLAGLIGAGILALIIALTLLQCSIKKPEAPTWESTLTVPLATDHLTAANLLLRLENGDQFVDDSGNVGLYLSDTLAPVTVGTDLTVPDQSAQTPQGMGQVRIAGPVDVPVRLDLADYYAGPAGSIPPFAVNDVDTIGPIQEYTWIAPAYGEAYLKIENQIGLDFDSVRVVLSDVAVGPLGTFDFPTGIAAGTADSQAIGIVGRQLHNEFQYDLAAYCNGGTLLSLSNRYLEVSFAFSDTLVVDSALMEVPAIVRSRSENVAFSGNPDIVSISQTRIASGTLRMTVENRSELAANVDVTVPSFTLSGAPLVRNVALPASDTTVVAIDLSGYTWIPEQATPPQYFTVNAVATTVATAPVHVHVRSQDSILVTTQLENLQAASITGVLAPQIINLPDYQANLAVPPEFSSVHLATATLSIDVVNGCGAQADLNVLVTGDNGNLLNLAGTVLPGSPSTPLVTNIVEPNLAAFLDPFPTLVQIASTAVFGDSVNEVTVTASDFASARVSITAPLAVRIDSVTMVGDVGAQAISGTDVAEFTDNLVGGTLHLKATSHLAFGAAVTLFVATDSTRVYSAPDLILGPVPVAPGTTDAAGLVVAPVESVSELPLTAADLQLFDAATLYVGQTVHLDGTAGQTVQVVTPDYLDLVAYFTVTMRNGGGVW